MRISILFILFLSFPAFAYIDPNVGSMLLQGLIATIAAGAAAVSIYWSKIKSFFSKKKAAPSDSDDENDNKDEH